MNPTKRLKQYGQFTKKIITGRFLAMLALFAVTVVSVAAAFEQPNLIKEVSAAHTDEQAFVMAGLLIAVGTINAVMLHWSNVIAASLVSTGLAHLHKQIKQRVDQASLGLGSKTLNNIQQTLYRRLRMSTFVGALPIMSAALALMANAAAVVTIAGWFSLFPLAILVAAMVLSIRYGRKRAEAVSALSTANREFTFTVQDVLSQEGRERRHVIGASYKEDEFEKHVEAVRVASFRAERAASSMVLPLYIGGTIATALLLLVAINVQMSPGASAAFVAAVAQMSAAMVLAMRSWARVQEWRSPVENALKALDLPKLPAYEESEPGHRLLSRGERKRTFRDLRINWFHRCKKTRRRLGHKWRVLEIKVSCREPIRIRFRRGMRKLVRGLWGLRKRQARRDLYSGLRYRRKTVLNALRFWCVRRYNGVCASLRPLYHHWRIERQDGRSRLGLRFLLRRLVTYPRKRKAICESIKAPPPKPLPLPEGPPLILFDNVSYVVDDTPSGKVVPVVHPFSLRLALENVDQVPEAFVFLGGTAMGKSTLGRLLLHLREPSTGRILVFDQDISGLKSEEIRDRMIALLTPVYFEGSSIRQVVAEAMGGRNDPELVERVFREVGLLGRDLAEDPSKLSRGNRSRLAAAEAILRKEKNPHVKILVMDDVTSVLDAKAAEKVMRAVARHFRDCLPIIMASDQRAVFAWEKYYQIRYFSINQGKIKPLRRGKNMPGSRGNVKSRKRGSQPGSRGNAKSRKRGNQPGSRGNAKSRKRKPR